jgi:hypothetical protein
MFLLYYYLGMAVWVRTVLLYVQWVVCKPVRSASLCLCCCSYGCTLAICLVRVMAQRQCGPIWHNRPALLAVCRAMHSSHGQAAVTNCTVLLSGRSHKEDGLCSSACTPDYVRLRVGHLQCAVAVATVVVKKGEAQCGLCAAYHM